MSGGQRQTDLLSELYAEPSTESMIRQLLDGACQHDEQARALRREAGRALARLRSERPETWQRDAGIDEATAALLLDMGSGRHG